MTDRELLEAAAKAAGMKLHWPYDQEWNDWQTPYSGGKEWNPLTNDGDAFRLMVRLNIWPVRQYNCELIVVQRGAAYFDELAEEPIDGDPNAATRRAIVRAAAEIGRNMV